MIIINSQYILGKACSNFFGIEGWYKYLPKSGSCEVDFGQYGIGSVWLILAGIIDILIRLGIFAAIIFFIIGSFKMITSQGSPEGVKSARSTMTNSIIGLVLLIVGAWLVSFVVSTIIKV